MVQRLRLAVPAVLSIALAGCTVHQADTQSVTGPSTFATALSVTASPDSLNQDGASQSAIVITARDASGQPIVNLPVRVDMFVGGVQRDFGTLSARNLVTGADGRATTIYTAPAAPPPGSGALNTVSIVATIVRSNAQSSAADSSSASIRLVPIGVITPSNGAPTASFTFSPTTVNQNSAVTFDASLSSPGTGATQITSYAWSFGDGSTGSGVRASHSFASAGTFNVTLTVTNNLGAQGSTSQGVVVGGSAPPAGDWFASPPSNSAVVGDNVRFTYDFMGAPGRQPVECSWDFGDGATGSGCTVVTHMFLQANTYTVALSVLDDAGQKGFIQHTFTVGTGNPQPVITFSPNPAGNHPVTVGFSSGSSTTSGGATITTYLWDFGDPSSGSNSSPLPSPSHNYVNAGSYTVRLTITDSRGRSGTTTTVVTVN
jgi:PKD repeat protein